MSSQTSALNLLKWPRMFLNINLTKLWLAWHCRIKQNIVTSILFVVASKQERKVQQRLVFPLVSYNILLLWLGLFFMSIHYSWASCFMSIHYYSLWPLLGLLFYVYTLQLGRMFYGYTLQLGLLFYVYTLMSITINYWVTRKVEYIVFRYRYSTLFKSLCYLYVVSFLFQLIIHAYSIFFLQHRNIF